MAARARARVVYLVRFVHVHEHVLCSLPKSSSLRPASLSYPSLSSWRSLKAQQRWLLKMTRPHTELGVKCTPKHWLIELRAKSFVKFLPRHRPASPRPRNNVVLKLSYFSLSNTARAVGWSLVAPRYLSCFGGAFSSEVTESGSWRVTRDAEFPGRLKFMRKDHPKFIYLYYFAIFEMQCVVFIYVLFFKRRRDTLQKFITIVYNQADGNELIGKTLV